MKTILTICSVFILFTSQVFAQVYTISGYVEDIESGEKLIGANIYSTSEDNGATTNLHGYFSVSLKQPKSEIKFSYIGYKVKTLNITLHKNTFLTIQLERGTQLEEVEIIATQKNKTKIGTIQLPVSSIKSLPALGGEQDVLKTIQLLPGVKFGNEGTTGIFVRGGTPDQNLILLDDVPIYNASHLFGFVSIFNTSAISHIEFIKSGFPARYGGRLASVLDIRTKKGNNKKWEGEVGFGLLASKLSIEGPLIKDKCSVFLSARRSFFEPATWINQLIQSKEAAQSYGNLYYYDLNAKVNYEFSKKDQIYFNVYFGKDQLSLVDTFDISSSSSYEKRTLAWGNQTMSLGWNHKWASTLFSNMKLYRNYYNLSINYFDSYSEQQDDELFYSRELFEYDSRIKDNGLIANFFFTPSVNHNIKFGGTYINHNFLPGVKQESFYSNQDAPQIDSAKQVNINANEARVYIEDHIKIAKGLYANLGIHASLYTVRQKTYKSIEPRISFSYQLHPKITLLGAYSKMKQYIHLLSHSGIGIPTDLWVPPTENVPPKKSWQVDIGTNISFNKGLNLRLEAYYKSFDGLIDYKEGASFLIDGNNWEDKIAKDGKGESYGLELFLEKKTDKWSGWLAYTLSWANQKFADINFGKTYPFRYDRRHDLSISMIYQLSKKVELSANWVYATGNVLTLPKSVYPSLLYPPELNRFTYIGGVEGEAINISLPWTNVGSSRQPTEIFEFGGKNNTRLPAYHRFDIGVNFRKQKKRGIRTWNFSLYNLYARRNPYYVIYTFKGGSLRDPFKAKGEFRAVSLFQVVPSFAYNFKF